MTSPLLGVVLAGGQSRRFGSNKALATLEGEPLWRRAAGALEAAGVPVLVLANDPELVEAVAAAGTPVQTDRRAGRGPLAGIETGLIAARDQGLKGILVLACDLVRVDADLLAGLATAWSGAGVAAFEAPGPWGVEPLCAVWGVDTLPAVSEALESGQGSPGELLGSIAHTRLSVTDVSPDADPERIFRSANRPDDLDAVREPSPPGQRHPDLPPIVSISGNKKSGKTTIAVGLIAELSARGRRVMSVKHGHHFRLDTPGTDSWRHRHEGGAHRVVLAGPDEVAVTGGWGPDGEPTLHDLVRRFLADAEVVVVEGYRLEPVHRIEVYRSGVHADPITPPDQVDPDLQLAVITDRADLPWTIPVFDPDQADLLTRLADLVEERLLR